MRYDILTDGLAARYSYPSEIPSAENIGWLYGGLACVVVTLFIGAAFGADIGLYVYGGAVGAGVWFLGIVRELTAGAKAATLRWIVAIQAGVLVSAFIITRL